MTLLFADGFDLYNSMPNKGWTSFGNFGGSTFTTATTFQAGRFGSGQGQAITISKGNGNGATAGAQRNVGSNKSTLIVGFAFENNYNAGIPEGIITFMDSGTYQLQLRLDGSGHLSVVRGGTTLVTETSVVMVPGSWYFLEFKVTFAGGTSGSYAVRRDGQTVPGIPDTTGVNTITSANAYANQIVTQGVYTGVNPGNFGYDDLILSDNVDDGTVFKDFTGDLRVIGLLPNGPGTGATQFAKVGASATNWQSVDESGSGAPNGDTDYVASSVVGNLETYTYADLPGSASSVLAVIGEPVARKDDVGGRSVATHVRSHGTEADAPTTSALTSAYQIFEQIMVTNPAIGAAWSVADFNACEFGPKVSA